MGRDRVIKLADQTCFFFLCLIAFFIGISNAGVESCFGFAFLAFIVKKIAAKSGWLGVISFSKFNLAVLFFLFFNIVSLVHSKTYVFKSLQALIAKWLEYILIYLIAQEAFSTRKRINIAIGILLFSCALVSIDGLYQYTKGVDFLRDNILIMLSPNNNLPAISASFKHYNDFAAYLLALLPLIICLYFFGKNSKIALNSLLAIELILVFTCLFLTSSRGGWLSFIASLIFMFIFMPRNKSLLIIFLIAACLFIFLPYEIRSRTLSIFAPGGDAQRFKLWYDSLLMIRDNPIVGKGVGTFMDYIGKYDPGPLGQYAHNCYLQIWVEIGIFGLFSFLWFIFLIVKDGIKMIRHKANYLLLGVLSGIFGFLVHSFFDTNLYSLRLAVLFWFMSGLAVSIINLKGVAKEEINLN